MQVFYGTVIGHPTITDKWVLLINAADITSLCRPHAHIKSFTSLQFDATCCIPLFIVAKGVLYVSDKLGFRVRDRGLVMVRVSFMVVG